MTTTIYQKYISRYAETFTMVERFDDEDFHTCEVLPTEKTSKMSQDDLFDLIDELMSWQNERASWEEL